MSNLLNLIFLLFAALGYILLFMFPLHKGAPYIPNNKNNIRSLVELLEKNFKSRNFKHGVDLGSGDGRIVINLSKIGIKCDGIEQNLFLYNLSKKALIKENIDLESCIYNSDFLKEDLSKYDLVILWQVPTIMNKLSLKLTKELKPDSIICSYYFKIPGIKEDFEYKKWHVYRI